jgi:hypothetical protein
VTASPASRLWLAPEADALVELAQRLTTVRRRQIDQQLHRAIYTKYLLLPPGPRPLYYNSSVAGRRYTPRGGPAGLYLSFDPATTTAELRAVVFDHDALSIAHEHDPITVISARTSVGGLLDLTDPDTCDALDVTLAELDNDWESEQDAHTKGLGPRPAGQLLAMAAHLTGEFAGIVYASRRTPFGINVVIFPDRLYDDEYVEVIDSTGFMTERLSGTAKRGGPRA